jgi:hypothetical protein
MRKLGLQTPLGARGEPPPGWQAPKPRPKAPGFDRKRQPSTPASR